MNRRVSLGGLVALSLLTAACSVVGPDHQRPDTPLPAQFDGDAGAGSARVPADWWRTFGDPQLDALVADAMERSPDARQLLAQIDEAARRGLAPAGKLAKHRAEVLAALASETKQALGRGLGSLSGAARDQALQARERVYLSRIAMAEKGREAVDASPLAVGAALALAGAAVACLFRQSETEDRLLGETRDQLAADLKAMAKREAVKASAFGSTLKDALKTDLKHASQLFTPDEPMVRPVRH